ncbi:hypothetical protein [Cylindrospermum stagnale]|uniref:hypothetical protein n=1 Tax=Cylindrospermum stagnale TaxID=142864 RepID=UPI00059C57BA
MTYFWRLIISVMIVLALNLLTPSANSSPLANTQITESDFFQLGVDNMQRGNYLQAIENLNLAIQMRKDFTAAYSDRCLAYLQLQDYHQAIARSAAPKAIADCTQAINLALVPLVTFLKSSG